VALFVIARSASDHHILAVRKEAEPHFPFSFRISGADRMVEGTDFAGPLDVTARLSKSGEAMPSSGDLEGVARGISPGAEGVRITLDTLRP
jgi:cytochrome c-type biogenesis protein CcmH